MIPHLCVHLLYEVRSCGPRGLGGVARPDDTSAGGVPRGFCLQRHLERPALCGVLLFGSCPSPFPRDQGQEANEIPWSHLPPTPHPEKYGLCPFRRPPGAEEERQGRQARTTWLEKQQAIFQLDLNERFGSPPAHSIRQNPSLGTGETQPLSAVPPAPSRRRVLPSSLSLTFPLLLAVMSLTMIILLQLLSCTFFVLCAVRYLIYFSNHPSGAGERCTAVTFFFFC